MNKWPYILMLGMTAMMCACGNPPVIEVEKSQSELLKENMINANKYFASSEETEIDSYIGRRGWEVKKLGNGTRLHEYQTGKGAALANEEEVRVTYSVEALNGQSIYKHVDDMVVMGRGQAVPGLEAALKELRHGSRAHVVIPSAMAYGVVGDGDKISTRMAIVLDMEVK